MIGPLLDPVTAERTTRLRGMLRDAQARAGDRSALGQHLAVVALDGVAELAMHLCAYELSLRPAKDWPGVLKQLRDALAATWDAAGAQGAEELHRSRNLVQHAGVLPNPDHMVRWAADVERFVRGLISAALGVDLAHATSGLAIADEELNRMITDAEELLFAGDPSGSFSRSWDAFDVARRAWASRAGATTSRLAGPFGHMPKFAEFQKANAAFHDLNERLDVATFTSDLGEWFWLCRQHAESHHRSPPTAEDAQRALAFVVGWILRYESYSTRYPEERWRAWRESQRASTTGVPGGPHVVGVADIQPWSASQASGTEWTFVLSDLPAPDDDFSWAVSAVSDRLRSSGSQGSASLGLRGELKVRLSSDVEPTSVLRVVQDLLEGAAAALLQREQRLSQREQEGKALTVRFESAFAASSLRITEICGRVADPNDPSRSQAAVSVTLEFDDALANELPNALAATMTEAGLPSDAPPRVWGRTISFPPDWPPPLVVRWLELGVARALTAKEERHRLAAEKEQQRIAKLTEMRRLLELQQPD